MSAVVRGERGRSVSRRRACGVPCLAAVVALLLPGMAWAQSAEEIFEAALQDYEARAAGVDNYTMVQEVMGMETVTYFEKRDVEGRAVFVPVVDDLPDDADVGMENPYALLPKLGQRATVEGTEEVDGERSWVLQVDDFSGLDLKRSIGAAGRGEFTPTSGRFWMDVDDHVLRKMWMEGEVRQNGETAPVSMEARFSDYREVEGMLHPFQLFVRAEGFADAAISPEEREQAKQALRELEEQLEEMPDAQRRMVEGAMRGQVDQLRQMVEGGTMEFTSTVKEILVNEGPPGGSSR